MNPQLKNIFCINLAKRPDRWQQCQQQFDLHGIKNVQRFEAVDGNKLKINAQMSIDGNMISPGYYGCLLSHLTITKLAQKLKLPYYVVFEDDMQLHKDFNALFKQYSQQIPADWDMVYLGANHANGIIYTDEPNVVKMVGSFTTHAMIIRKTVYDALIKGWGAMDEKLDIIISRLHRKFNCYCFTPNLCVQRDDYSDILNRDVSNHGYMKNNFE